MATIPSDISTPASRPERREPPVGRNVPVVEFDDVTKVYDGGNGGLDRVSLRVGRGEFVFLVGPTGCGKSTFIRLLMQGARGLARGRSIAGRDIGDMPRKKVPKLRRNIGVVFQDFKLLPNRTVYDNVAYASQVIGESRQRSAGRCRTSCASWASPPSCTTTRTSCRAASSSACRSRGRS